MKQPFKIVFSLLLLLSGISAFPQAGTSSSAPKKPSHEPAYLSKPGLNRVLSNRLGVLVTGQSNGSAIANYAAFDPVDGSFTFKGSIALGKRSDSTSVKEDDDVKTNAFLSFKIEGDLITESYASLFENTKLNTGTSLEGQLHFGLKLKSSKYKGSDKVTLGLAKKLALADSVIASEKLNMEEKYRNDYLESRKTKIFLFAKELDSLRKDYKDSIELQRKEIAKKNFEVVKRLNSNTDTQLASIQKLELDSLLNQREIDSTEYAKKHDFLLRTPEEKKIVLKYKQTIAAAEDNAPLSELRMSWFTAILGLSKKSYYTYTPSAPFHNQINKEELGGYKAGFAWNYYCEDQFPRKRSWLFNIGFLVFKDNNTTFLGTQDIDQEVEVVNSGGDTTRTISKKYVVYTDSIVKFNAGSLFSNIYLVSGSKSSAIHFFPSYDIYDGANKFLNLGIGIIVSFKNTKKDEPVINAEGYIQFKDILNSQKATNSSFNRNEIGIRFGIPFNFL